MRIGIPKEIEPGERRVAATPRTVQRLCKMGFTVAIERGAGMAAEHTDAGYAESGAELMFYRLRRADGSTDRFSAGSVVEPEGRVERLSAADVELEVRDWWTGASGTSYPASWALRVPRLELRLDVTPRVADQELDLTFRYWEGAVSVRGERSGRPARGVGYVELTGYGDEARRVPS